MKIKGFVDTSLVDWDGHIVSVIWTGGCNFRCPFCFNSVLVLNPESLPDIPESRVLGFLESNKAFIDGICITGGEPTLQTDINVFCMKVKCLGLKVKLDTNGSNPAVLKQLIAERVVDYVALDVKAPLEFKSYSRAIGIDSKKVLNKVKESVDILMSSGIDYELRTTIVPGMHKEEDVKKICESIRGAKKYVLQAYRAGNSIDPEFRNIKPPSKQFMLHLAEIASKYVEKTYVRGLV